MQVFSYWSKVLHFSLTYLLRNIAMSFSAQDIVPISEARARLTELSDEVVGGAEKLLTKNGSAYVAIVDAKKLDYYHALEEEHASLVLLTEAEIGLQEVLAGKRVSAAALMGALAD
jgi:antitoxin (DNA-binding transcriptional repressor) of toxin-antitoxin stability system